MEIDWNKVHTMTDRLILADHLEDQGRTREALALRSSFKMLLVANGSVWVYEIYEKESKGCLSQAFWLVFPEITDNDGLFIICQDHWPQSFILCQTMWLHQILLNPRPYLLSTEDILDLRGVGISFL